MKTEAAPAPGEAAVAPHPSGPARSWLVPAAIVSVVCGLLLAFFLSIYPVKGFTTPTGWDASEYLWRTQLARDQGLLATTHPLPSAARPKSGRPAYVVLSATLSSLGRVDPLRLEMVMASIFSIMIGLAAGAFAAGTLRRPPIELAVIALMVALSPAVIRLMTPEGYLDTMLSAVVLTTAAAAVVLALEDRRAVIPAVALLGVGATVHWTFFSLMAGAFALFGVMLIPHSWRRWRGHSAGLLDTPTGRVAGILVGGGALGAGFLFGVLGQRLPSPRVDVSEFAKKLSRDIPKYHFAVALPAAVLGAAALAVAGRRESAASTGDPGSSRSDGRRSRYVLALLLSWCAVILAGFVARRLFHQPVPAHRFLSFGLAIPILIAIGLLWLARVAWGRVRLLGVAVALAGLVVAGAVAHVQWFSAKAFMDRAKLRDSSTAAAYLAAERIPVGHPFVLIVGSDDWNNVAQIGNTARASVPPDRLSSLYMYVGTPDGYLAHRPVDNPVSRNYFERMKIVYARNPVAFLLASFNRQTFDAWAASHADSLVASTVAVVQGPVDRVILSSEASPAGAIAWWMLGIIAAGVLLVLLIVGGGWSFVSFGRWFRPVELLAVAPAFGVASIVVLGSVVDRLGLRLTGVVGAGVPIVAALSGWLAWILVSRRRARSTVPAA